MRMLSLIISAIILSFGELYILAKTSHKNIDSSIKIFIVFLLTFVFSINSLYIHAFLRPLLIIIVLFLIKYILFEENVKDSIIGAFYIQFLCVLGEIVYAVVLENLFLNLNLLEFSQTNIGIIVCNFLVTIVMILLANINTIKKLFIQLRNFTDAFGNFKLSIVIFIFFTLITLLFYSIYYFYYYNHKALYLVFVFMFALFTIIILMVLYYYNNYTKVKSKYNLSIKNLKEYEDLIDHYMMLNHENKNNLLTIRNMGDYEAAKKYIDQLINNKEETMKKLSYNLKKISSKYLRSVIYTKMVSMDKNNIENTLLVNRKINSTIFAKIDDATLLDICNIISIFLDNAIEATLLTKKKSILIELDLDEDLIISISNTYKGELNISTLSNLGYTTKGNGHGYGLSIVKQILSKNKMLINNSEANNNIFTQILKIKLKNVD